MYKRQVHEVDRVLVDVLEDLGADGGELGLGVTRGGVGQVARVALAKVALGPVSYTHLDVYKRQA